MKTLGMFAKQPVAGRVKTRLASEWGNERAAELYEAFVRDLIQDLDFSSHPDHIQRVLGFTPTDETAHSWFKRATGDQWSLWPQPDTDFGGRIAAFFAEFAVRTDSSAVLIGSDAPTLPVNFVHEAFDRLQSADVVLCPASDGGYCLIGLRGGFDAAALFKGIAWSSEKVLGQTVKRARNLSLSVALLPVWYDVDSQSAVEMLRGHLAALQISAPRESCTLNATRRFLQIE